MTVKAIRLENFMAFKDTGWVELRPITLVFGRNSSGKSAIIRALRLLRQSLDRGTRSQPLAFVVEGGLDQGDFKTTVNRRPNEEGEGQERYTWERIMSFAFRCRLTVTHDILQERIRRAGRETDRAQGDAFPEAHLFDFKVSFAWDEKDQRVKLVGVYILGPAFIETPDAPVLLAMERYKERLSDESWNWLDPWYFWGSLVENYEGDTSGSPFRNAFVELTSGWLPTLLGCDSARRRDAEGVTDDFDLCRNVLDELTQLVQAFLKSMRYLGPMRPEPQRSYILDQGANLKFGWGFTQVLSGQVSPDEAKKLNRWFRHLGLGASLMLESTMTSLGGFARVDIQETDESNMEKPYHSRFNLRDVGYGASQVLPIVSESVLAPPGTSVFIEQPELHLHPKLQVELADLFIDRIHTATTKLLPDASIEVQRDLSNVRFFLETHSEHLFLRFLRRIAETTDEDNYLLYDPDEALYVTDLNTLFVNRYHGFSRITIIAIAPNGTLINTPQGFEAFFADDIRESIAIARSTRRKGQRE